ncbi:MAG: tetratricopeptide repeat protein [Alphaproteobacteria bacterium]|nr:tetratricopeptide repeat protein [Alphaproteobacteria bacterium]
MAEAKVQRRLAAISAADVVGYSRLMREDETGTLAQLKSLREELLDPKVIEYGGRIVKTTGDGMLIEFPSAVGAVQHASDVQLAITRRNADTAASQRMEIRIGINVGDVIVDGEDLFGDGVNLAARLEGLAEPGGVCVSGSVYEQVRYKLDLAFEDMGEQAVKNIDEPVRVYRVGAEDRSGAKMSAPDPQSPSQPDKPSIAVLPFDNLSGDPEQEYFSDGMAEDLITDISKISGLFVVARNSSFAFKGQAIDVKAAAEQLGVRHILEGSVRKMGPKLRVNVQLIDAASGGHVWAERYDGDMEDIFQFQDDIREQIVSALQVSLTPTDKALTEHKQTDSPEAYDLFLKGRAVFYQLSQEHLLEAINFFDAAVELDPNFADAYGYLSFGHFFGWTQMWPEFDNDLERANQLAERAVALDGTSGFALSHLGWVQAWLRRYNQAIENFETALALAPNDAEINANFGQILNYWGNPERGLQMLEKAFSMDKFAPPLWNHFAGMSHLLLHEYDESTDRFQRALERAPMFAPAYLFLACAYVQQDRLDDARGAIKTISEIAPSYNVKEFTRIFPFRNDDVRNELVDSLRKAGLPE